MVAFYRVAAAAFLLTLQPGKINLASRIIPHVANIECHSPRPRPWYFCQQYFRQAAW